jgi:DNA-directed RNA polymerase subunit K/omega
MQTRGRLTKYECSAIIGIRANQLDQNAPVAIADVPPHLASNHLYIAARELLEGQLPMQIRRPLPHDRYVVVNVADLDVPPDVDIMVRMFGMETR